MDPFTLVPKDKFDCSSIEELKLIDVKEIEPIIGKLLEWIQDINWPIAEELIEVLPRFHKQLVPHIKEVFSSNDEIWKCWVLCLLRRFPLCTIKELSTDIKRIAEHPTEGELYEEVNEYALEVIKQFIKT